MTAFVIFFGSQKTTTQTKSQKVDGTGEDMASIHEEQWQLTCQGIPETGNILRLSVRRLTLDLQLL